MLLSLHLTILFHLTVNCQVL